MSLRDIFKALGDFSQQNAPTILAGVAVGGVVTTAIFAAKGGAEASVDLFRENNRRHDRGVTEQMTGKEQARLVWRRYIPAVSSGVLTIAAIVAMQRVSARRYAAVAAAFSMSEKAFDSYRDKVVRTLGETKEHRITDEVSAERVAQNPNPSKEVIITGKGDMLCFEPLTSRYFESNRDEIDRAVNRLNEEILRNDYASLNDFYNWLGIPTSILGDDLGWTSDKILEVSYSSHLAEDGRPCLAIYYQIQPSARYYRPSAR